MSDEIKTEEKNETKCFCQNKEFRKFLVIALGTFVGAYAALSLFAALHRPPMMPPCPYRMGHMQPPIAAPCPYNHHKHHFDKGFRGDKGEFQKVIKGQKNPAPFDNDRDFDKD